MTVILSKKSEYAVQSLLYLTLTVPGEAVSAGEIAEHLNIPKEFVSKILQELTDSGLIESKKGKGGGFQLGKHPSQIYLLDIVKAIDGDAVFDGCVLGFPGCSTEYPCPVHFEWVRLRNETLEMLSSESIEVLSKKSKSKIDAIRRRLI